MDRDRLDKQLESTFEATDAERRVVVRQAGDLDDSGQYDTTHDGALSADVVLDNLSDAPDEMDLIERWNWWIGALELAHENYDRFRIRRWQVE